MDYPYLPPYDWNQLSAVSCDHRDDLGTSFYSSTIVLKHLWCRHSSTEKKLNQKKINDNLFILILNSVITKRSNKICSTVDNLIFTDEEPFGYDPLSICILLCDAI